MATKPKVVILGNHNESVEDTVIKHITEMFDKLEVSYEVFSANRTPDGLCTLMMHNMNSKWSECKVIILAVDPEASACFYNCCLVSGSKAYVLPLSSSTSDDGTDVAKHAVVFSCSLLGLEDAELSRRLKEFIKK